MPTSRGAHRLFLAAVLGIMIITRIWLIRDGGQYFFYDEAKFRTSTEAATLLLHGKVASALAYAVEPHVGSYADHIGFKLLGILPEIVEHRWGRNVHVPAYFFGAFSVLSVLLLAAIARRLTGSRRAFDLTLLAGGLSATLLVYARFLVPYDLSLCFALLGLWIGVKRPAGLARSAAVGALAAWAFFCYFGYWQLAGAVVFLHALWTAETLGRFFLRLAVAALGSAGVVLAMLGISHLGSGTLLHDMVDVTRQQSFGWNDFRSGLNSWAYLFYAERTGLFLWVAAFALGLGLDWRGRSGSGRSRLTPLTFTAAGFLLIYAVFILDSDIRHHLVVHGRHSRQLVPFLLLGFALGLDRWCASLRRPGIVLAGVATLLAINAVAVFVGPLTQEFPLDFKARAEALLRTRPPLTDGNSYYRLVNVDNFILEPEVLRAPPLETLLASRHPLQYRPFLFEGESLALQQERRSIDQRMRLVRMAVPDHDRIRGEPYGAVTLSLEFSPGRDGFKEPLLAIGPPGAGGLFFIDYCAPGQAMLGFEDIGVTVVRSSPFAYAPGTPRVLQLFAGSLMPPGNQAIPGLDPATAARYRRMVYAALDGRGLLNLELPLRAALPGEVYAGVNTVGADSAGAQFSGHLASVVRGGRPPPPKAEAKNQEYGPVHLRITWPAPSNGTAEPLVAAGEPGRAVLGYMRLLPHGQALFGVEIWGLGTSESPPVSLDPNAPLEVEYSFGSLYPEVGRAAWKDLPYALQQKLKRTLRIVVNGQVALEEEKETPDLTDLPVFVARNPIGGSVVNAGFSGQLLRSWRVPLDQLESPAGQ